VLVVIQEVKGRLLIQKQAQKVRKYQNNWGDTMSKISDFIEKIKPIADEVYKKTGVLPSVTIAQGIQETGGNVNNVLASKFNFFGEKGKGDLGSVRLLSPEDINGVVENHYSDFKVYSSPITAAAGRAKILQQSNFIDVGKATTFEDQTKLLKAGGYATDRNYVANLNSLNKEYNLSQYDKSNQNIVDGVVSKPLEGQTVNTGSGNVQLLSWNPIEDLKSSVASWLSFGIYAILALIAIVALFLMVGGSGVVQGVANDTKNSPAVQLGISAVTKGAA
jgi:hypothetical protein